MYRYILIQQRILTDRSAFFWNDFEVHVGGVGRSTQYNDARVSAGLVDTDARDRQLTDTVAVRLLAVRGQLEKYLVTIPVDLVWLSVGRQGTLEGHTLTDLSSLVRQWLE